MAEVPPQRHALACEVMIPPLADIVAEYLLHSLPLSTSIQLSPSAASSAPLPTSSLIVDVATIESNRLNSFDVDWRNQKYEFWLTHLFPEKNHTEQSDAEEQLEEAKEAEKEEDEARKDIEKQKKGAN